MTGIMASDGKLVRESVFDTIRVDRIEEGKLFNLYLPRAPKDHSGLARGIGSVTLRKVGHTDKRLPSASFSDGNDAGPNGP